MLESSCCCSTTVKREFKIHRAGKIAYKRDHEPCTEPEFENEILQATFKSSMCMSEGNYIFQLAPFRMQDMSKRENNICCWRRFFLFAWGVLVGFVLF